MDFVWPAHVALPRVPHDVALSDPKPPKKFEGGLPIHLPQSFQFSFMHDWVDDLPIDAAMDEIVAAVREAHVTIITSETGSGKSTRAPQFVLDDHQRLGQPCRIVVTQQRRLAAMEIAHRVASGRGESISYTGHGSIGYAVKDDIVIPCAWNSIVYATYEKLLSVFEKRHFTHVFIDEAHDVCCVTGGSGSSTPSWLSQAEDDDDDDDELPVFKPQPQANAKGKAKRLHVSVTSPPAPRLRSKTPAPLSCCPHSSHLRFSLS